jgi:hypothetical protein
VHVARVIWTGCREGKYPSVFGFNISVSRLTVLGSCSLQTAQDRPTSICNPFKTETRRECGTKQLSHRTHTKVCFRMNTSSPSVSGMLIKASRSRSICSDVGIYDRVVIQDILKEIAQTQQVDFNAKQKFKGPLPFPLSLQLNIYEST